MRTIGNTSVVNMRSECKRFISIPQYIIEDPVAFFKRLTRRQCYILNKFLYLDSQLLPIYIRQETVGMSAGASREYANRVIKYLCEMGFLSKQYRHMTSCVYVVNEWFRDVQVRSKLKHLLSALSYFHLSLLVPQVTQVIYKYLFNTIPTQPQRVAYSARACVREKNSSTGAQMIAEHVANLKIANVSLTIEDKIKLSRFDRLLFERAERMFRASIKNKQIDKPVGYLLAICKRLEADGDGVGVQQRGNKQPSFTARQDPSAERRARKNLAHTARIRGETEEHCAAILVDPRPLVEIKQEQAMRRKLWSMTDEFKVLQDKALRTFPGLESLRPAEQPEPINHVQEIPQRMDGEVQPLGQQPAEKPLSHVLHSLFMA